MNNPSFKHVTRAPYELGCLIKIIGEVSTTEVLTDIQRNQIDAASTHATNVKEVLLTGIESIGNILMRLCELEDPIEKHDLMGIAGIIRHSAVELQHAIDVEDEMDGILERDKELTAEKKGGAK